MLAGCGAQEKADDGADGAKGGGVRAGKAQGAEGVFDKLGQRVAQSYAKLIQKQRWDPRLRSEAWLTSTSTNPSWGLNCLPLRLLIDEPRNGG